MLSSSLSYIIIRSFPESIILILASYKLMEISISFKAVFKTSIFYLILLIIIRKLPISFGTHTIISMFILGSILYKLKNQDIIKTIVNISKIYICLGISEVIYMVISSELLNLPIDILTDNTKIESALLTLPSLLIFIFFIIILNYLTRRYSNY